MVYINFCIQIHEMKLESSPRTGNQKVSPLVHNRFSVFSELNLIAIVQKSFGSNKFRLNHLVTVQQLL